MCDNLSIEDANHMILQCNALAEERTIMFNNIVRIENNAGNIILRNTDNLLGTLLGKPVDGVLWNEMITFWCIVATNVYSMFKKVLRERAGIG